MIYDIEREDMRQIFIYQRHNRRHDVADRTAAIDRRLSDNVLRERVRRVFDKFAQLYAAIGLFDPDNVRHGGRAGLSVR